jgi:transposase
MARGRKTSLVIVLSPQERATIERWQRATTMAAGLARRGRMILLLAEGHAHSQVAQWVGVQRGVVRKWAKRVLAQRLDGLADPPGRGAKGGGPPEVALHVVRLACERPDPLGRSLSQWDCAELARQLIAEGIVADISAATVRRMLTAHHLKPWRHHAWLHPKQPRDATFYAGIAELIDLYTRPLGADEMVLSVDEKTSLQPRPRSSPPLPAQPHHLPHRHEHEYTRAGALNLFAAFETRSGPVYGQCYERKRQQECIAFLEYVDRELAEHIRTIHLVCDNVSTHHGKEATRWFANHPRLVVHFTPVHGSWMNQVEQWFRILQRKRLRIVDFTSKDHLRAKLEQFIREWNQHAHPFNWTTKSVAKVLAQAPALAA